MQLQLALHHSIVITQLYHGSCDENTTVLTAVQILW
jgi:hypothetical protein